MLHSQEVHPDYLLYPVNGGIKLIKPSFNKKHLYQSQLSVEQILKMQMNVYFTDYESKNRYMNEETARHAGYQSVNWAINKTVDNVAEKETANFAKLHDREVLMNKKVVIKEETYIRKIDKFNLHETTIKFPWYDDDDNVIGVFGCTIISGIHNIAAAIQSIVSNGLFTQTNHFVNNLLSNSIGDVHLSMREAECLRLLIRGHTAKMIAQKLNISVRTVEHYVENIKCKFNIYSKYELINKVIEMGFFSF